MKKTNKTLPTRLIEKPRKNERGFYVFKTDIGTFSSSQIGKMLGIDGKTFTTRFITHGWLYKDLFYPGSIRVKHLKPKKKDRVNIDSIPTGTWESKYC